MPDHKKLSLTRLFSLSRSWRLRRLPWWRLADPSCFELSPQIAWLLARKLSSMFSDQSGNPEIPKRRLAGSPTQALANGPSILSPTLDNQTRP